MGDSGDLDITDNLTITGAGAAQTIIDGTVWIVSSSQLRTLLYDFRGHHPQWQRAQRHRRRPCNCRWRHNQLGRRHTTVNDSVISGNKAVTAGGIFNISMASSN